MTERMLKTEEVEIVTGMSRRFIERLPASELPKVKFGRAVRYAESDVRRFIEGRRVGGNQETRANG